VISVARSTVPQLVDAVLARPTSARTYPDHGYATASTGLLSIGLAVFATGSAVNGAPSPEDLIVEIRPLSPHADDRAGQPALVAKHLTWSTRPPVPPLNTISTCSALSAFSKGPPMRFIRR
jgi:hypothetical protein